MHKSSSSPPHCPVSGTCMHKNENFKELPMASGQGPNSLGVDGNHRNNGTSRICHGAATPSFGLLARVSCSGPLWTWLGGYARPNSHIISSRHHIKVWVLFSACFPLRNSNLYCNCDIESFCCESGLIFLFFTIVAIDTGGRNGPSPRQQRQV